VPAKSHGKVATPPFLEKPLSAPLQTIRPSGKPSEPLKTIRPEKNGGLKKKGYCCAEALGYFLSCLSLL
jgi:hypothetical protein